MLRLPTGSIVGVVGVPDRTEKRYWDAPKNSVPRADAWFWACGCTAEPASPGRFDVEPCTEHRDGLTRRFEKKARLSSAAFAASLPRIY